MSSSSDGIDTTNLIGIKVVAPGDNPTVDIVFVHGLEGNPYKTWTYKEKGNPDVYWPKDLLAQEIPEARILAYGYNTSLTAFFGGASTNMIHHHAMALVSKLQLFRARKIGGSNSTERPIIWVCHSLGGILVKRALIYSQSCGVGHNEKLRSIMVSTQGILFLGTPHMGSNAAAWGAMAHKLVGTFLPSGVVDKHNTLLKTLEKDSETLQNITSLFVGISQSFDIIFFFEEIKTSVSSKSMMIVEQTSAVLQGLPNTQQVGIHATHQGMVKYKSEDSPGYSDVAGSIREYVDRAEKMTPLRWRAEKQRSVIATNEEIDRKWLGSGHVGDSYTPRITSPPTMAHSPSQDGSSSSARATSPGQMEASKQSQKELMPHMHKHDPKMCLPPSVPPFVVPYTQNQSPIKRHHLLTHIDETLQNKEILAHGHASILVWGPPGSGKTHLIREYVFNRRNKFPGGIFWVKAKNTEDRNLHYRRICQELKLTRDEDEEEEEIGEYSPEDDEEDLEVVSRPRILATWGGYESSVEKVVNWLKRKTNWLLVIDGANVDTEDEIDNLKELIPAGAGGQIIFTSLNKNLASYARLGPPSPFEMPMMTLDEGIELLLSEARLTDAMPSERDCASKLVEMMDYLPLAIHLSSNYISENGISIHAYFREYRQAPKVSGPGWTRTLGMVLKTLKDKHPEAWNLLNLISFFAGDMPVELLKWGSEVLPRQIKIIAREDDGTRDFHLSVKHLLAFSLVKRTHEKEREGHQEWRVDRLHVQTVIQSFCRQQLGEEQGKVYARCASDLFCHAFDLAERVRNDGPVFVKDIETFILHGEFLARIMKHLGMKPRALRATLKQAHEVKEHQIKIQDEAIAEGKEVPLPRRSIFGRADSESPLSNFNSRATTFGSQSSTTTTSDEHTDSSSMKSRELASGNTDDGNSSKVDSSQAERNWTEVNHQRRKPTRTFSSSSNNSTGHGRGQYTGRRYPRRASNQVHMNRRRTDYEYGHGKSISTGASSTPGRGRGMTPRYTTTPIQPRHASGSNSRMSSKSRDSPARVNPSSVVGPRDSSPRHHIQRESEYQAPPRANITDRLSPARGPLYSDVARGKSNSHSRHSSRDTSRNRRVRAGAGESMSRDSSRSTQSFATVMPPTAEMVRVASHPASEPPMHPNEWSPPRQSSRGRGRVPGSGSGSRRGSVESVRGRRASPMDPQRMRASWQKITPPPPLPVEPAYGPVQSAYGPVESAYGSVEGYGPVEMSRLASAPAAMYVGIGESYYAEQNASVEMPIAPPLFPMGELVAGEGYLPRPTASYALARGQIPVQVPLHVPTVAAGPPGIFIPLAQTASAPPSSMILPSRSAPPSGTSSYPVRVHHGLPARPEYLQANNALHNLAVRQHARSLSRDRRDDRRGSLPELFAGAAPSVISDPGEHFNHWDMAAFQIAASEPDLGRSRMESSPPPPSITRTLATQTSDFASDFAAMGSQFEGVDALPESIINQNGGTHSPPSAAGSPKLRPMPFQPKLARAASTLSNASSVSEGTSAKSPTASSSFKKGEESAIEKFSKNVLTAWKSATETKKKVIEPGAVVSASPETPSTKFDTAVKKTGWIKLGKKD